MKMMVVVVIPVYQTFDQLKDYELISLRQTLSVLHSHPIYFFGPDNLDFSGYEQLCKSSSVAFNHTRFDPKYFADIDGYSKLLLSPFFYSAFRSFDYMLVCQTDAYVFSDELLEWCRNEYDFVGAPWVFRDLNSGDVEFSGGNGGFSLRKIKSHLKVLHSFKRYKSTQEIMNWYNNFNFKGKLGHVPYLLYWLAGFKDNTHYRFNNFSENEDVFWTVLAPKLFKWFRIPKPDVAMKFAMELEPSYVFQLNNQRLPFGCHAFRKYEPEFWNQYIH